MHLPLTSALVQPLYQPLHPGRPMTPSERIALRTLTEKRTAIIQALAPPSVEELRRIAGACEPLETPAAPAITPIPDLPLSKPDSSSEGEVEGRGREIDLGTCDTMEAMPTDIQTALGAEVRKARRAAGLNQTQAAELITEREGFDPALKQSRLSQIENGDARDVLTYESCLRGLGRTLTFSSEPIAE